MVELRWTLFWILGFVFAYCAAMNIAITIHCAISKKFVSMAPLVGGLAGAVALLVLPIPGWRWLWWLPPLLDIGCVPVTVWALACLAWMRITGRKIE